MSIKLMRAHNEETLCVFNERFLYLYIKETLDYTDEDLSYGSLVKRSVIQQLITDCDKVLKDNSLADDLLPNQTYIESYIERFVPFDTGKYNKNYFKDVKNVYEKLSKVLKEYEDINFLLCEPLEQNN